MASRWRHCADLTGPGIEPQTSRTESVRFATELTAGYLFIYFYLIAYLSSYISRESDQCAIRARLGVAGHLSTTPRWGNPAKCLSQRHNK